MPVKDKDRRIGRTTEISERHERQEAEREREESNADEELERAGCIRCYSAHFYQPVKSRDRCKDYVRPTILNNYNAGTQGVEY